ncbi:MAG: LysR substrate-binding domain-containing protein [Hyphomicrobiales bacterium]
MTIEFRHMRVFIAVAQELSFRRAGERLHIAQPALSRTIADLEAAMSVSLIERTTRVVRLTEAGRKFLEASLRIVAESEEAVTMARRIHQGELGELIVGYNDFAINGSLPTIVREFRASHPDVSVRLATMTSPQMTRALAEERIDIGFLTGSQNADGFGSFVVKNEQLVCVLPVAHPLAVGTTISMLDLDGMPFVEGQADLWGSFLAPVHEFCRANGCRPRVVQTAQYSDGIIGLVEAGMGVALYVDSDWLHSRRGITVRPIHETSPPFQSLAVWNRHRRSAAVGSFLETTRRTVSLMTSCSRVARREEKSRAQNPRRKSH